MPPIVNIAAYQFADLGELPPLRDELRSLCAAHGLKGTILLSPEGINLFVAGTEEAVAALVGRLRQVAALAKLEVKRSMSETQPFHRMLVKIKREIIAFGVPGIDPQKYTSRRLAPEELKAWLDAGRPVTLLDTRNNFEFSTGTFRGAVPADIDDFRDFPAAIERLPASLKAQPVVTFCTGGIRCEKAAPLLEQAGFREVYQLDGGILKYFERCGGEHYDGDCFVFDQRVALDAALRPSGLAQCFACQAILSREEQQSPAYVVGQSCPHCYEPPEQTHAELLAARRAALRAAVDPLPGSMPYDNVRPISVPLRFDGLELLDFLDAMRTHLARDAWRIACHEGRLVCRGERVQPGRTMRAGERLLHTMPATREPDVATGIELLHEDESLVVVNKPAPLPMHPCGRFNRNTLSYILEQVYQPIVLRPAHRLDADASGVVVFSKSRQIAQLVQPQFADGRVTKIYLARVQGHPASDEFECDAPLAIAPGEQGVRLPQADGAAALTRFRLLEKFDDGTALVEATPVSGRTNQIRAHLWQLRLPIVGDTMYLSEGKTGTTKSLGVNDPPLCLHAGAISLCHPQTGERVRFAAPPPAWCNGKTLDVI